MDDHQFPALDLGAAFSADDAVALYRLSDTPAPPPPPPPLVRFGTETVSLELLLRGEGPADAEGRCCFARTQQTIKEGRRKERGGEEGRGAKHPSMSREKKTPPGKVARSGVHHALPFSIRKEHLETIGRCFCQIYCKRQRK